MSLRLYNTLSRAKEDFAPLDPQNVRMYVCGPTVYDFAHIGNARPVIVFDVLFRLLRHLYGEEHVTYVRNITDIDDKINARAQDVKGNRAILDAVRDITSETGRIYQEDVAALGSDEERKSFDEMLGLCRHVFPHAEGHKFFIEHWGTSLFFNKMREIGAAFDVPVLSNQVHGGVTPILPPSELQQMGFAAALYPIAGLFAASHALASVYQALAQGKPVSEPLYAFGDFVDMIGFPKCGNSNRSTPVYWRKIRSNQHREPTPRKQGGDQ